MYLSYIDESGKPNYSEKDDFILSAVVIHESLWMQIDNQINTLKAKYFPKQDPRTIEFHTHEIVGRKKIFRSLNFDTRYELVMDLSKLIANNEISLFSVIFQKFKSFKKPDINTWAFRLLFERLSKYMNNLNTELMSKNLSPEFSILLIDSINDKFDLKIREIIRDFFLNGTYYQYNKYIIEDPLFVKSHFRNISQLADFVAFITARNFDIKKRIDDPSRRSKDNERVNEMIRSSFDIIRSKFNKSNLGKLEGYGIKFFPG